jgi:hypothetical protein
MSDLIEELQRNVSPIVDSLGCNLKQVRQEQVQALLKSLQGDQAIEHKILQRANDNYPIDHKLLAALKMSSPMTSDWQLDRDDSALADRWRRMETLPDNTLGKLVVDFYQARGFSYPGEPGSVPPLLAQHDFVHVLADYGTRVESELEVFAFIAWSGRDVHAFSILETVLGLFETGYLQEGVGVFEADPGHLSKPGMVKRLADALDRATKCNARSNWLRMDWFSMADFPVDTLRRHFGVRPKSDEARELGSAGPWDVNGITEYQLKAAKERREQ